ncbi:alkaline phosphatase family protein [Acidicapsa acidisoli]|uniref:alkaline phosphatase family protein n=1 Tax=Acidicapsa acidisoli TaxID=1615681 RepID=UPI0021E08E7E|nr:alkaline phosphatase family protein [Acidicapsa acidisoli]
MRAKTLVLAGVVAAVTLTSSIWGMAEEKGRIGSRNIKHVVLLSIDGMHEVDFYNCTHGIAGANGGDPYCPNLAELGRRGISYVGATSSKPSDSFPGLTALITGGTPKTTGIYYDVAYDRSLDAPAVATASGLAAGPCTPYGIPTGTTTDNTQGIDIDATKLNGGAPGASLTDGTAASIDYKRLVRDPQTGCLPVWPWQFIRTNTIFGVVHKAGGYTAWIDKRPSYAFVNGPGDGKNVDDLYVPEVASNVVPLPGVKTALGVSCATVRDTSALSGWTSSFLNVQCYDALRVKALLNEIEGKTHTGAPSVTPAVFGMNFQSVYYGQSLNEPGVGAGGYKNAAAVPSEELLSEIEFVDASIGDIVNALKDRGIYDETLVIVTAKHGESPIDPTRYVADGANTPATLLGTAIPFSESPLNPTGIGATEDDVSVLWLKKGESVTAAVDLLEANATALGLGEILYGPTLAPNYHIGGLEPGQDPRSPDIIVTPNLGITYSGSTAMIGDHGGFAHDDTNVMLLVANPHFRAKTVSAETATTQVAPTILKALGLDPNELDAVRAEGTQILPDVLEELEK